METLNYNIRCSLTVLLVFLPLKDLNTLRNHQTTQKSKSEFICLQRVCKGRHQSHGWERWIKAGTRWRTVETDMITGKGTFSDILTNFSSSFSNNRRISIRSLFFLPVHGKNIIWENFKFSWKLAISTPAMEHSKAWIWFTYVHPGTTDEWLWLLFNNF